MYFRKTGCTYSASGTFTKDNEKAQKLIEPKILGFAFQKLWTKFVLRITWLPEILKIY